MRERLREAVAVGQAPRRSSRAAAGSSARPSTGRWAGRRSADRIQSRRQQRKSDRIVPIHSGAGIRAERGATHPVFRGVARRLAGRHLLQSAKRVPAAAGTTHPAWPDRHRDISLAVHAHFDRSCCADVLRLARRSVALGRARRPRTPARRCRSEASCPRPSPTGTSCPTRPARSSTRRPSSCSTSSTARS